NELHQLGEPVDSTGDVSNMLLSIIPEFCNDFRAVIEGKSNDMPAFELSGGARISFVFHEIFTNGIKAIDPLEEIKDVDIRTLLCNSAGSSPALFVATNAFETIVKKQIKRLESPCLRCVTLIYEELVRIVDRLLTKQVFKRFPDLKEEFGRVVIEFLKNALIPTNTLVEDMVSMEQCYINTAHPDFIGGQGAITRVNERLHPAKGSANDRSVQKEAEPPVDRITELDNEMNIHGKGSTSGSIFGSFISTKRSKNPMDAPFPTLKPTGTLSERERTEIEVIKLLIKSYFNIVKRTTIDMVPKAIMLKLVNHSKQDLQRELLKRLYNPESIKNVMKESDATVKRRKECKDMVKALEKADE
ncbi:vacuolar protein sorting-associated protein 1, partial [Spiromyces aspiralis]